MNAQLFLVNSVSTNKAIETLSPNELGIYGLDSVNMQTINASSTSKVDTLYLGLGKVSGGAWLSRHVQSPRNRNFELRKFPYRDAVKQVKVASINCLGTSPYDEFILKISTRAAYEGFHGLAYYTKSFSVTGKFANATALYTALANELTTTIADGFIDSVVPTSTGIQIVAKVGQVLDVSLVMIRDEADTCNPCITCEAVVTTLNAGDTGSGTYQHVLSMQKAWGVWTGRGYMTDRMFKLPNDDFPINPATKWDLYYMKWTNENQPNEDNGSVFNVYQEYMIAVPQGTDMSYYVQTIEGITGKTHLITTSA